MFKHSRVWFLSFLAILVLSVWAVPSPSLAAGKIGVVNMDQAINECKQGKRAQAELRRKASKLEAELKKKGSEVAKLRKDLENTAMLLKPEAKLSKEREYERKARRFQQRKTDASQEMRESQRDAFSPILQRMSAIIKQIGAKSGYSLITESRAALFYPKSADITQLVIAAFDKKYP
jgi:outer membrane protein